MQRAKGFAPIEMHVAGEDVWMVEDRGGELLAAGIVDGEVGGGVRGVGLRGGLRGGLVGGGGVGELGIVEFVAFQGLAVEGERAIAEVEFFILQGGGTIEDARHWPTPAGLINDGFAKQHHTTAFGEEFASFAREEFYIVE